MSNFSHPILSSFPLVRTNLPSFSAAPTVLSHLQKLLESCFPSGAPQMPSFLLEYPSFVSDFAFKRDETAFSSLSLIVSTVCLYLALIFLLRKWISYRKKAYDLAWLVVPYNLLLSVLSLVLFLFLALEILNLSLQTSLPYVFCDYEVFFSVKGPIVFFYFINFLFKFVELFDTVLIVLRGKTLIFLHVYHHAATLVLCYSQLIAQSCMQWVVIAINLFVHIFLYYYYFQVERGNKVWWKKYLTSLQIVQFFIALFACFGALGSRKFYEMTEGKHFYHCHGDYASSWFGIGILLSYLFLFIQLYFQLYRKAPSKKEGKKDQ